MTLIYLIIIIIYKKIFNKHVAQLVVESSFPIRSRVQVQASHL
jgi:hypothetical protein